MTPLRSLALGDQDYYLSPYLHGVAAACPRLGMLHSTLNIRADFAVIRQRVLDVRPHLLWTHMLLSPPPGGPRTSVLLELLALARRRFGTVVLLHDGDCKVEPRYPHDLSSAVDLALCNHRHDRSVWKIPTLYWPYACFPQDRIADPVPEYRCEVFFGGQVATAPGLYNARGQLVHDLAQRVAVRTASAADAVGNTLLRTAEVAASADTVLGFGRPGTGWVDTRVFQYPGAGAVLLHDDVPEDSGLEPGMHYLPYASGQVDSVVDMLARLRALPAAERRSLRERAFQHGQAGHSYVARVRQVLDFLQMQPS